MKQPSIKEAMLPIAINGHCTIEDDLGNVLLDEDNAVHPQNMARVISRALSNEENGIIHRIALGNGGTEIDAAFTISFKTPNDGQPPDTQTWESRLYNETYSEIIDESNILLGVDPGSSGPRVGTRTGGGSNPADDPASDLASGPGTRSRELGLTSEVVIVAVLNPSEPAGQLSNDQTPNSLDSSFTFDEIGLYTTGAPALDSAGSQDVDVSDKTSTDQTTLLENITYDFEISVDSGTGSPASATTIELTVPSGNNNPTYGDLCEALNDPNGAGQPWGNPGPLPGGATISITDTTFGTYPTIEGAQTFGFLRFTSGTPGSASSIALSDGTTNNLFAALPGSIVTPAINGQDKGLQNNIVDSNTEQERLLTHLIFSPVLKAANRTLTITYTLTVSVARTQIL